MSRPGSTDSTTFRRCATCPGLVPGGVAIALAVCRRLNIAGPEDNITRSNCQRLFEAIRALLTIREFLTYRLRLTNTYIMFNAPQLTRLLNVERGPRLYLTSIQEMISALNRLEPAMVEVQDLVGCCGPLHSEGIDPAHDIVFDVSNLMNDAIRSQQGVQELAGT